jgi:hypothetical protein
MGAARITLDVVRPCLRVAPETDGFGTAVRRDRDGGSWPLPVNAPRREKLHDRPWSGAANEKWVCARVWRLRRGGRRRRDTGNKIGETQQIDSSS